MGCSPSDHPSVWLFTRCFFISVATIIGLGIMSLPVLMYKCGFEPFVLCFALCGLMQYLKTQIMTELLQHVEVLLANNAAFEMPKQRPENQDIELGEVAYQEMLTPTSLYKATVSDTQQTPDFHTIGLLLLPWWLHPLFDALTFLSYTLLMIAYAISSAQIYGNLLSIGETVLTAPYVFILGLFVCIGSSKVQPFVVAFTLVKGTVLLCVIIMTSVVGFQVFRSSTSDWGNFGDPFIICTIALSGTVPLQPYMYGMTNGTKKQVKLVHYGIVAAIAACWVLNVIWTFVILKIVPQQIQPGLKETATLEGAYKKHEIGTVPLIVYLRDQNHGSLSWLGTTANVFIVLSVSISFVVQGMGLNHQLDGFTRHILRMACWERWSRLPRAELILTGILYVVSYLSIFLIAQFSANSLYNLLEGYIGLIGNLQTGVFLGIMYLVAMNRLPTDRENPEFVGWSRRTSACTAVFLLLFYGGMSVYGVYRSASGLT